MRKTALVYATGTLLLLAGALPVRAQYVNPYTNNNWNNANSSLIDTTLMGMRNQMMLSNSLFSSRMSLEAMRAAYNKQLQLGNSRIKRGQATTRFTSRTFPMESWVKRCGGNTPAKRKQIVDELSIQRTIWSQEARARSADTSDMAQALGLAFVLAWEAQTGEKPTAAQYKGITNDFRTFLLKDAMYQGMDTSSRQTYSESNMVNATDQVRLLREGQRTGNTALLQKAHAGGLKYTNSWLPRGFTHYEAIPNGFRETR